MKTWLMLGVLGAVGVAGWKFHASESEATDGKILRDRIWIDHMPRSQRDMIEAFAVLSEQPVGVYNKASMWAGSFEGFRYEASGGEMRMLFPQSGAREQVRFKARRCNDRGMDFCLDITGGKHGVEHYYSREGWEIGSVDDEVTRLRALEAAAPGDDDAAR
ncbi:MAG TPA: hypothetical protein VLX92_13690 [Kofleriaceae bacterium]|nr:hypothetical protein [Kofleriaceae bacterium]